MSSGPSTQGWAIARTILATVFFLLSICSIETASGAEPIPGTLKGDFSVSLGGSAQYSVPIAVPEGTSGMAPKFILSYDSNAGPGNLGLGWSVGGLSYISRTPKTKLINDEIAPVTFTSSDALTLDGSRLVPVGSNGGHRLLAKVVDDQTRVEEISDANGTYYIARTKAGLRMYYGDVPSSRIQTKSGKILVWPCVRIEDTFGNAIEFSYRTNGYGDWGLESAKYTSNKRAGLSPYAELRFKYHEADNPIVSYIAGEQLRRTLAIDVIESGVFDAAGTFNLFRRYEIGYDETGDTNRFGSQRVRAITETGAYGETHRPTTFEYSEPQAGWTNQPDYRLPAAFGSITSLEDGYRFIDLDSDSVKEIIYAANFLDAASNSFKPYRRTYKLIGNAWQLQSDLNLPEALATSTGTDTGAFFYDVDDDKYVDFFTSSKTGSDSAVSRAFRQDGGKWVDKPEYKFPVPVSVDGQRKLVVYGLKLKSGERGLLAYDQAEPDLNKRLKLWSNNGLNWTSVDIQNTDQIVATSFLESDLTCDGNSDLVAIDKNAGTFALVNVENVQGVFKASKIAGVDLGAAVAVQAANAGGCGHLIVKTSAPARLLDLTYSTGTSLDVTEILVGGVTPDDVGRFLAAPLDAIFGEEILLRLNTAPNLDMMVVTYKSATKSWERLSDYDLAINDDSERLSPGYLPLTVDTNGDSKEDVILLPTSQILPPLALLNRGPGWMVEKQFVPDIAFAQKDKLGIGPQFVDLNGDSLIDLVGHVVDENGTIIGAASINTANGWIASDDYVTPMSLTNQKSGTTGVLVDVTSDGIVDFVYGYAGVYKFWKNTFELVDGKERPRYWVEDANFPPPPENFSVERYGDLGVRFIDVNADGRVDILVARREIDGSLYSRAYLNSGASWIEDSKFRLAAPFVSRYSADVIFESPGGDYYRDLRGQLIDLNGDGLVDYVYRYRFSTFGGLLVADPKRQCLNRDRQETKNGVTKTVKHPIPAESTCAGALINTGAGWVEAADQFLPLADLDLDITEKTASVDVLDINGDSLSDLLVSMPNSESQTFLSTGAGWDTSASYAVPKDVASSNEKLKAYRFLDLNADGLIDVMYGRPEAKAAHLNTGFGWAPALSYAPPFDIVDAEGKDLGVRTIDVDGNGRPDILRSWKDENGNLTSGAYLNLGGRADTLLAVTNGLGLRTEFSFRSLLQLRSGETDDTQFYTPSPISEYPIISHAPTTYAVEKMTTIEAADRKLETTYRYKGFRFDLTGAVPLGFESREAINQKNQVRELVHLGQTYFTGGRPTLEISASGSNVIAAINYDYAVFMSSTGSLPVRVVLKALISENYDLNGSVLGKTENTFEYDEDNNVIDTCVVYGDGSWTFTKNEYSEAYQNRTIDKWFLGRLTKSTVTTGTAEVVEKCRDLSVQNLGVSSNQHETRTATFTYENDTGVLKSDVSNASSPLPLKTTYERDAFGNIIKTTKIDDRYRSARFSSVSFDELGRFVVSETNALGHIKRRLVDGTLGTILASIDQNGVKVDNEYDGFGRVTKTRSPNGVYSSNKLLWANTEAVEGHGVAIRAIEAIGTLPPTETWMDLQGRVLRVIKVGTDDRKVFQDTVYDVFGRATKASLPYFENEDVYWTTTSFDVLNRPVKIVRPDGAETVNTYDGLKVSFIDPLKRVTTKVLNKKGLVVRTVDQNGSETKFEYDPSDALIRSIQVDGESLSVGYDEVGNRVVTDDPDLGNWEYKYNAFGEVIWQRDAKGQITTVEYDDLGRVLARVMPDKRTDWTYDHGEFARGSLVSVRSSDGFAEVRKYDLHGRLERQEVEVENEFYATFFDYDEYDRLATAYYPHSFAVKYSYDKWGFLSEIASSDPDRPFGTWLRRWDAIERDQYGRVLRETFANGVETVHTFDPRVGFEKNILTETAKGGKIADLTLDYDLAGNLVAKSEDVAGSREEFMYDGLYRLASWSMDGAKPISYTYDDAGRILQKSDVGFYRYDDQKPAHAVSAISAKKGGNAKWTYEYDANGNMVFGPKGHFEYYSDNSVRQITARKAINDKSSEEVWSTFSYAPDGYRYLHQFRNGDLLTRTISTGPYERIAEYGAVSNLGRPDFVRHRVYVSADTGLVAVLERVTQYDPYMGELPPISAITASSDLIAKLTTSAHYFTKDQLGSITHVTDSNGVVTLTYRYDPWGKRWIEQLRGKHPNWPGEDIDGSFHKGFTGHEQLDHLDLIHMGGRVYDPTIARFVSADPTLQYPLLGQNYDRYSYVLNNPLRFVDPTGFGLFDFIEDIGNAIGGLVSGVGKWLEKNWRTVVVVAVAVVVTVASAGTLGPVAAGMLAGAVSGGLNAALYGGDLSDIMRGAIFGAATGAAFGAASQFGSYIASSYGSTAGTIAGSAAHGVAGGIQAELSGGSFWSGFASGVVVTMFAPQIDKLNTFGARIAASSVVGGTTSVIAGGKFENGAITGAYARLFSETASEYAEELRQSKSTLQRAKDSERRPELEKFAKDKGIKTEINKAWKASNPGSNGQEREQGFWILKDDKTGALSTAPFSTAGATNDQMIPGPTPSIAGRTPVAFFHTHPNQGNGYVPQPSSPDLEFARNRNLPGIIKSHTGMYYFGP